MISRPRTFSVLLLLLVVLYSRRMKMMKVQHNNRVLPKPTHPRTPSANQQFHSNHHTNISLPTRHSISLKRHNANFSTQHKSACDHTRRKQVNQFRNLLIRFGIYNLANVQIWDIECLISKIIKTLVHLSIFYQRKDILL